MKGTAYREASSYGKLPPPDFHHFAEEWILYKGFEGNFWEKLGNKRKARLLFLLENLSF